MDSARTWSTAARCRVVLGVSGAAGCLLGDRLWSVLGPWYPWPALLGLAMLALSVAALMCRGGQGLKGMTYGLTVIPAVAAMVLLVGGASILTASRAAAARLGVERAVVAELAGSQVWVSARGRIASEIHSDATRTRFTLAVSEISVASESQRVKERLTVVVQAPALEAAGSEVVSLDAGDEVIAGGYIEKPRPGMEDRALRSRSLGTLRAREFELGRPAPRWLAFTSSVRRFLRSGAEPVLGPEQSGLLMGLMYGDTEGMTYEVRSQFRRAGLSHLTAVSGQNFVLVMAAIGGLLRLIPSLWSRRRLRTSILIVTALAFVAMTRWEPSVLRAGAMAMVFLVAYMAGVKPRFGEVVSVAVFFALIGDPMLVFAVAFQLSVAATLSIAFWARPVAAFVNHRFRIHRWIALPAGVAAAAELGVAPLIAAHFGTVQTLSVPANLLAVPAATIVSVWGYVACAVAALFPPSGGIVHLGTSLPLRWMSWVAESIGSTPVAEFEIGRIPWAGVIAAYATVFCLMTALKAAVPVVREAPERQGIITT